MEPNRSPDLARATFQLLALGALIASGFWIVRPFLVASTWATMIAVATWPLLLHAPAWLGGRRSLAVAAMTIVLLLVLLVPFYFGVTTIVENAGRIADWSKSVGTLTLPQPPAWVSALPLIGSTRSWGVPGSSSRWCFEAGRRSANGQDPQKRSLTFVAKDSSIDPASIDRVGNGAVLQVFSPGDSETACSVFQTRRTTGGFR